MKTCWYLPLIVAFGISSAVSAAPKQQDYDALAALRSEDLRVASIFFRLAVINRPLCHDVAPVSGMLIHDAKQYGADYREAAITLFGLADGAAVEEVVADSPAAIAGLKAGDVIIAINGQADPAHVPASLASPPTYSTLAALQVQLDTALRAGPIDIEIERGGETRHFKVTPVLACASTVQLLPDNNSDAGADGHMVSITTGMVGQTRSDDELAFVLGHEMAHNALRHRRQLDEKHVSRGLLRVVGKNAVLINTTEREADYLGLYFIARAGFNPSAAPRFWARFGRKSDLGFLSEPTHPRLKDRVNVLTSDIAQIESLQKRGLEVVPDPSRFILPPPAVAESR